MLYATSIGANTVTAYNAATGAAVTGGFTSPAGFTPVTGLETPFSVALYGNDLFVTNGANIVGEYDATTGAVLNASFVTA